MHFRIHSIDWITEPFIASWYSKNYTFGKWNFVKKSKNIWWFWENTKALTIPMISESYLIMTDDVTAISKSGSTYAQTIFEDIPLSFESWSVLVYL